MSLSLDGIQNVVLLFSDPVWSGEHTIPSTIIRNLTALSNGSTYSDNIHENLTVLTSKYSETANGVLQGLLYVPDLPRSSACHKSEQTYVPTSAVRQSDLPPTDYNLIALAPWYDINCTKAYLASARLDPLRALIFYLPTDDASKPPEADSEAWDLQDNGLWKTQNHYPIFAVSGALGANMMHQLSLYSGNLTSVPYGQNISDIYNADPDDYIRIWTELSVSTPSGLLKLWVFILIILGVLLAVIILIIISIRCIWRRRRRALQRRVMAGEVNLETMGIQRLTVPEAHIQKFPLFTYNYEPPPPPPQPASPIPYETVPSMPTSPTTTTSASLSQIQQHAMNLPVVNEDEVSGALPPDVRHTSDYAGSEAVPQSPKTASVSVSASVSASGRAPTTVDTTSSSVAAAVLESVPSDGLNYQPTCQICLEDFENRVTVIRELPCGHIFHPECIDEFLTEISSLCPLCKTSMLPPGYCPQVTNNMVRRERSMFRLRERVVVEVSDGESRHFRIHSWSSSVKKRFHHSVNQNYSPSSFGGGGGGGGGGDETGIELQVQPKQSSAASEQRPAGMSEATRRRMHELAGGDVEDGNESRWSRIKHSIQQGFS